MARCALHPLLVLADSDMRVPPDFSAASSPRSPTHAPASLPASTAASRPADLVRAPAAGVTPFPPERPRWPPRRRHARLLRLDHGAAARDPGAPRRLRSFAHHLADDYALGAAVHGLGLDLVLAPLLSSTTSQRALGRRDVGPRPALGPHHPPVQPVGPRRHRGHPRAADGVARRRPPYPGQPLAYRRRYYPAGTRRLRRRYARCEAATLAARARPRSLVVSRVRHELPRPGRGMARPGVTG